MATINVSGYNGIINNLTVNGPLTAPNFTVAKPRKASMTSLTTTITTSTNFVATSLTLTITPQSASSSIFLSANFTMSSANTSSGIAATFTRQIGSGVITDLATGTAVGDASRGLVQFGGSTAVLPYNLTFIDSPNTTSAITYTVYIGNTISTTNLSFGYGFTNSKTSATPPVSTLNAIEIL
jgi:hypothetical protein